MLRTLWDPIVFTTMEYIRLNRLSTLFSITLRYKHIVMFPFKFAASQAKCIYLYKNLRHTVTQLTK